MGLAIMARARVNHGLTGSARGLARLLSWVVAGFRLGYCTDASVRGAGSNSQGAATVACQRLISQGTAMSENPESSNERPCLHCLIGDLIDEYYAEYGTSTGETDVIDIDETISALAKTIADLTYGSDIAARQRVKDDLIRDIAEFEAEYEKEPGPGLRH
jgi:hypothetical protein